MNQHEIHGSAIVSVVEFSKCYVVTLANELQPSVPKDAANRDHNVVQAWIADGGVPTAGEEEEPGEE